MEAANDMKNLAQEVVSSYVCEISAVSRMIEYLHHLMEDFKTVEEETVLRLRESLASGGSLRKKDFDSMVKGVLDRQNGRQKDLMDMLKAFMQCQEEAAGALKKAVSEGDPVKLGDTCQAFRDTRRDKEQEINSALRSFKSEYEEFARSFQRLLEKGETLNLREFKETLEYLSARQEKRLRETKSTTGGSLKPHLAWDKGGMAA